MRRAPLIELSEIMRGRCIPIRLVERANIVLSAAEGIDNQEIGKRLNISRHKVGRWRTRYAEDSLLGIQADAPRTGRPPTLGNKISEGVVRKTLKAVSYTHLRAHETVLDLVCRL